jgi:hypothetical protein
MEFLNEEFFEMPLRRIARGDLFWGLLIADREPAGRKRKDKDNEKEVVLSSVHFQSGNVRIAEG